MSNETARINQIARLKDKLQSPGLSAANRTILRKLLERLQNVEQDALHPQGERRSHEPGQSTANTTTAAYTSTTNTNFVERGHAAVDSLVSHIDRISSSTAARSLPEGLEYNEEQLRAIQYANEGKSFVLTGAAGTGKTTTFRGIVDSLIDNNKLGTLQAGGHKYLRDGAPGIVLISYTNKAVENVKKRLPPDLHANCLTAHKLLEYEPVKDTIVDTETGKEKTILTFEPQRTEMRPLPSSIRILAIDEATMMDVPLWNRIIEALPKRTQPDLQLILIGDINQLPPIFGKSIFIHALQQQMLRVELTRVYRQALENPILALAHRILSGKVIPAPQLKEWNIDRLASGQGKLQIIPWKKKLSDIAVNIFMRNKLPEFIDSGIMDPEEDIIITPFNKAFGTDLLNNIVATHLARKLNAPVYEIFTGIKRCYFRIGERILYNKSEARILDIRKNPSYFGNMPRPESTTMDYEGIEHDKSKARLNAATTMSDEDIHDFVDSMLEHMGSPADDDTPAKRSASHIIKIQSIDSGAISEISTAGEVNALTMSYALTVHKTQGSEYRKVFFISHHTNAVMLFRELIYVAVTRAKEELVIICEPNLFVQGITSQRIPGHTVEQKIENFEKLLATDRRGAFSNDDQIPKGLNRFIPTDQS